MHRAYVSDTGQSRPEGGSERHSAACSLSAPSANSNARSAALRGGRVRSLRIRRRRVPDDAKRVSRSLDGKRIRDTFCKVDSGIQCCVTTEGVG
jgi:hypothetical protein